ncbi:hypothetical protein HPB51_016433 [Rhipicephalus microplus]|uniref:Uncharacterized protein n=1 Tax=Rhipicephalus microplus TaxID=6941 RepID=A0A9J6DAC8_RHIMP|nr:hypothetical protein HPB51_016433 [Rhipicephalus microplus]
MQVMMDVESISSDECTEEYGWQAAVSKRMSTKSAASGDLAGAGPNTDTASRTFVNGDQVNNRVTRASRMPYVSKDHLKIILRPRGGINISNMGSTTAGKAIIEAVGLGLGQTASDIICPNVSLNIIVASTSERENAERYVRIRSINLGGWNYEINAYAAAPDDTCKGVIRNIDVADGPVELERNIVNPRNPLALSAKKIRNTGMVIIAFDGYKVPNFVRVLAPPRWSSCYSAADPLVAGLNPGGGGYIFYKDENAVGPSAEIWVHVKKPQVGSTALTADSSCPAGARGEAHHPDVAPRPSTTPPSLGNRDCEVCGTAVPFNNAPTPGDRIPVGCEIDGSSLPSIPTADNRAILEPQHLANPPPNSTPHGHMESLAPVKPEEAKPFLSVLSDEDHEWHNLGAEDTRNSHTNEGFLECLAANMTGRELYRLPQLIVLAALLACALAGFHHHGGGHYHHFHHYGHGHGHEGFDYGPKLVDVRYVKAPVTRIKYVHKPVFGIVKVPVAKISTVIKPVVHVDHVPAW